MASETIAHIVAEKRNRADEIERDVAEKMKRGEMISDQYAREVVADLRKEADRLEAAADCLREDEYHRGAEAREKFIYAVLGKPSNAAAMREALEFADRVLRMVTEDNRYGDDVVYLVGCMLTVARTCRAAIAKPPRNCDRYSHDEALSVWAAEKESGKNGCFDEWLYAPATEKEGGEE